MAAPDRPAASAGAADAAFDVGEDFEADLANAVAGTRQALAGAHGAGETAQSYQDLGSYSAGALVVQRRRNRPSRSGVSRKKPKVSPKVAIGWGVLVLLLAILGAFFALAPKTVVSILPGAARLYAMMGSRSPRADSTFRACAMSGRTARHPVLRVEGNIVNITAIETAFRRWHLARGRRRQGDYRRDGRSRTGRAPGEQRPSWPRFRRRRRPSTASRSISPRRADGHGGVPAGAITELFSAEAIAARVDALAGAIAKAGLDDPLIVAVLKGSFIFAADLVRALNRHGLKPEIDFMFLASYDGEPVSRGEVRVLRDVDSELAGRDVVLIDDILDFGRTLAFAKARLVARGAKRVLTCVLIDKQVAARCRLEPDFSGFICPSVFVVGYGMDLRNRYRELPFIGELKLPGTSKA